MPEVAAEPLEVGVSVAALGPERMSERLIRAEGDAALFHRREHHTALRGVAPATVLVSALWVREERQGILLSASDVRRGKVLADPAPH